jgi:5'-nucleotidase
MTASPPPRVLIVNDDGIDGPGIKLLEELVSRFTSDIWVVAPDEERSGAGHSISISHPIRLKQRDERHFAIKGSPTDCALLGIHELLGDRKPDILFSGINAGPNLAEDITYSGTCSAAMEGAMLGIPSVALSQFLRYRQPVHWETSRHFLPGIIERLITHPVRPGTFVNVNVPDCAIEDVTGIRVTTQGRRPPGSYLPKRRIDERTVPYYWIKIAHLDGEIEEGSDLAAMRDRAISITPLQLDMTDRVTARELEGGLADLLGPVKAAA